MKITVLGAGYVGLVTGACLADVGHEVTCVDVNADKVALLKKGIMPIYEPGLEEIVKKNYDKQHLKFVTSLQDAPKDTLIYFIAVGTPSRSDGSADLRYVTEVARDIGCFIDHYSIIINKSTVPIGTSELVRETIANRLKERKLDVQFDIVSNPEFLKEGDAVSDFMSPDRIVIGTDSEKARVIMRELYAPLQRPDDSILMMSPVDAEMTKYVSNAMLATKISFMNEMANVCERIGADVENIRLGIGSDSRIGYSFINPGCGYGGSCFPKDVKALISISEKYDFNPLILHAVEQRNFYQKQRLHKKLIQRFGEDLTGLTIGLWGLAFKPGTDDMREAPSRVFLQSVIERGARVQAFDPVAMETAERECPPEWFTTGALSLKEDAYEASTHADVLVLVTDWPLFRNPDWKKIRQLMKGQWVLDGRNQYDSNTLKEFGFEYEGIGRS